MRIRDDFIQSGSRWTARYLKELLVERPFLSRPVRVKLLLRGKENSILQTVCMTQLVSLFASDLDPAMDLKPKLVDIVKNFELQLNPILFAAKFININQEDTFALTAEEALVSSTDVSEPVDAEEL